MGFGGFIVNCITDVIGRRRMIPLTLILTFGSNFAGGFAHSAQMLRIYVFALGCGYICNKYNISFI